MELKTAIEILQHHYEWMQGKQHSMRSSPAKLSEALDVVLKVAINHKADIEAAYNAGREFGCKHDDPETGEQYYQETYSKEYAVWTEGYAATGESSGATFHGKYFAPSFRDAVLQYIGKDEDRRKYFSEKDGVMRLWGCRFFDNEKDARVKFG